MRYNKISITKIFLLFIIGSITISCAKKAIENDYGDPTVFEDSIEQFEIADKQFPPSSGAVVIYEGDNDIAQGIPPRKIIESFTEVINKIHKQLQQCRIYFSSIKPSASRWNMWPKMVQTNKLIAEKCANDGRLIFVDVSTAMLNEDGKPRDEIFLSDELHMNRAGYEIWTNILKPILIETELRYE